MAGVRSPVHMVTGKYVTRETAEVSISHSAATPADHQPALRGFTHSVSLQPRAGMVDVYHELAQPQVFLRSLKRALKPGGRLVLIEFRKESEWVPIREEHKMSVREARMELEAEGFTFDRVIDVLPWQHILVFRPKAG
jgi:SAM-dependent methyltransferase